jgi:hypothetical protein
VLVEQAVSVLIALSLFLSFTQSLSHTLSFTLSFTLPVARIANLFVVNTQWCTCDLALCIRSSSIPCFTVGRTTTTWQRKLALTRNGRQNTPASLH